MWGYKGEINSDHNIRVDQLHHFWFGTDPGYISWKQNWCKDGLE